MRLAFDKYPIDETTGKVDENRLDTGEKDQIVYDVLRFVYNWNKNEIDKEKGWQCIDGHADPFEDDPTKKPEIYWILGSALKIDPFREDTD